MPVLTEPVRQEDRGGVLVVDDDPWTRDLLQRTLVAAGFPTTTAADGQTGLELARQLRPRAIVLDVLMPGMGGWEVLTRLKGDPQTADIPVVMLTMTDDRELGVALGAAHFISKPVDREGITKVLQRTRASGHALLVEDDPMMQDLMSRTLATAGWTVTITGNGADGLEALGRGPAPDVVLLDLMMPGMDGFEFLGRIRADPAWRSLPVVVVTAKDLSADDVAMLASNVAPVLQKGSIGRDALLAEVVRMVRMHTALDPVPLRPG